MDAWMDAWTIRCWLVSFSCVHLSVLFNSDFNFRLPLSLPCYSIFHLFVVKFRYFNIGNAFTWNSLELIEFFFVIRGGDFNYRRGMAAIKLANLIFSTLNLIILVIQGL